MTEDMVPREVAHRALEMRSAALKRSCDELLDRMMNLEGMLRERFAAAIRAPCPNCGFSTVDVIACVAEGHETFPAVGDALGGYPEARFPYCGDCLRALGSESDVRWW